jgi:hypothetical protein
MSKTAVVVFSDPRSGGEEALGRLFNAMLLTLVLKEKERHVELIFQGAGTRWPAEVTRPDHPAHTLYHAVADKVAGVCGGCADVFGAADGVRQAGLPLVRERDVAGTSGIIDLSRYLDDGYRLVTF